MAGQMIEKCIYCYGEVRYDGAMVQVKCASCGRTFAVMKFQSEQQKIDEALEAGERAKAALAEAEAEKQAAQQRLNAAVSALEGIELSQANAEAKLGELLKQAGADRETRASIEALLKALKSGQDEGQDALQRVLRTLTSGQTDAEAKLELLGHAARRLLDGQSDIMERLDVQKEIVQRLNDMQMDAEERTALQRDFIYWSQSIHEADAKRLESIVDSTDALMAGQREMNEKLDGLRQTAEATQKALEDFRSEYQADKLGKLEKLYHQAVNYQLVDRAFDKAAEAYRQMLVNGSTDTEVYWRLVLCHYCVEYQRDDEGRLIPTILNPDLTPPEELSVRRDLEENAGQSRPYYTDELSHIDRILDNYREVRDKVQYDVFISVKQSDGDSPTKDRAVGLKLYQYLTKKGLRVFNSECFDIPAGQEYEPYIISALMSAKALIVVGSRPEYMLAQWVRNEWSRFQWLQRYEKEKTGKTDRVLFCYLATGMSPEKIPKALNPNRQAILDNFEASIKLDQALGFMMKRPTGTTTTTAPSVGGFDKIIKQMKARLFMGKYELVLQQYESLIDDGQYSDQLQLHLCALCANRKVNNISFVVESDRPLKQERWFMLARELCASDEDQKALRELLQKNEAFIQSNRRGGQPESQRGGQQNNQQGNQQNNQQNNPRVSQQDTQRGGAGTPAQPAEGAMVAECLKQMRAFISVGDFEQAQLLYDRLADRPPYKSSARLHLYGLCAERRVKAVDLLPASMVKLADNQKLRLARANCRDSEEMGLLNRLVLENEAYIEDNTPKPEAKPQEAPMIAEYLKRMRTILATGHYDDALRLYDQIAGQPPYSESVQLHLYGLCAERRVKAIDLLATSDVDLAQEPKFKAARSACRSSADMNRVNELLQQNEAYIKQDRYRNWSKYKEKEKAEPELSKENYLEQMYEALKRGDFDWVTRMYDRHGGEAPYKNSSRTHLYALCAERRVKDLYQLAQSTKVLADEPKFQAARMVCHGGFEQGKLDALARDNREYIEAHPKPVDDRPPQEGSLLRRAERGDRDAQYELGRNYDNGTGGVSKNAELARKWYTKAAEQGHRDAQNDLGVLYITGRGVKQDYAEAMKWYRKAAENGSSIAQSNLGAMYENGMSVPKDYVTAAEWYRKSAEQGYAPAQCYLGALYFRGNGVKQDFVEAMKWFRRAADQGHREAQNWVGLMFDGGRGVTQDYAEAARWYRKAADQGHLVALNNLGVMHEYGQGMKKDYVEAGRLYRKAAEQGYMISQKNLATLYYRGNGVARDYAEAMRWYRRAADQNYAPAQYWIGLMYERGNGVPQDYAQAAQWYRKAAEGGCADAQNDLGVLYEKGLGVAQNYAEAERLYLKSAEQNYARAQSNLGILYHNGSGVPKNHAEAMRWFRKAADQGIAEAQNWIGVMYERGEGVPVDYGTAVVWYSKAASQGESFAENNLGVMYENGRGVKKDFAEAMKWYRKSAEHGNALGQNNLGVMYHNATGVKRDYAEAAKWYRLAAGQGQVNALYNLGVLYEYGNGVRKDLATAKDYYRQAARKGHQLAINACKRLKVSI